MKLDISGQIFEKSLNTKFHQNLSNGSRLVPCEMTNGRTDGSDEANSRFSQFSNAPKNEWYYTASPPYAAMVCSRTALPFVAL